MLQNNENILEDRTSRRALPEDELSAAQNGPVIINSNFVIHLSRYIGETVTIFVTAGGKAGLGFTGVILSVDNSYVRLITRIGPPPACPLGNSCTYVSDKKDIQEREYGDDEDDNWKIVDNTLGSITDIPIDKIVAFTHNTV
ncbi:MAG: SAC domain-containing protein [Clostridium sp.]